MTDNRFSQIAQVCAGLTVGLGLLAAAGWGLDFLLLAQAKATFIPMAQSTLLSFIALGSGAYARARWPQSRLARQWNWIVGSAALVFSGFLLVEAVDGFGADLEEWLFGSPGTLGDIPMGRMSIATAGLFVLSSLSVLLSIASAGKSRPAALAADILASGVAAVGLTLLIAYGYGTPLLYGGRMVPPALTTALAFVFLGLALLALDGREGWPTREFVGASMRAVLLRTFLPFITIIILLEDWVDAQHWGVLQFNPALLAAIWVVVFTLIVGAVIVLLARYRGDELDKTQRALRESEEQHRLVVENAGEAIVVAQDRVLVFANGKATELTGYSKEELAVRPFDSLIYPEDRSLVVDRYTRRLRGEGIPSVYSVRIVDKGGKRKWLEVNAVLISWEGKPATLTFLNDITARKRAEEDLRMELSLERLGSQILQMQSEKDWEKIVVTFEDELQSLVKFQACSINIIDPANEAAVLYFTLPEKVGKRTTHHIMPALRQAVETGKYVYRRNLADIARYNDEVGQWGQVIQSVLDVPFIGGTIAVNSPEAEAFTERDIEILERFAQVASQAYRRLEDLRALAASEERFRQAQKLEAVGQLAGGVAHDFNNLLTIIDGYSELLRRKLGADAPQGVDELNEITKAAERGSALVRQLLAFSRQQVLRPEVLNLNAAITGFEKMLRRLLGEDVELQLHLEASLGQVLADEGQMQQILMNLAVNARDAMPDGGRLTIETDNVDLQEAGGHFQTVAKPGPYVRVSVSDTGLGMDEATRERIFEPFFTTKAPGKGTGLGLATVYGIVKQSEGYIWVYSEPEQGTTFRIYLPRVDKEVAGKDATGRSEGIQARGTETVLVVEDEAALRRLVCATLTEQGYMVLEAENVSDAIRIAEGRSSGIHLLLTDVIMPEMNGRELANTLTRRFPAMRVLFMSGYSGGVVDRHGVLDEGVFFLEKPFGPDTLARKVREVLDAS